MVRHPVIPSLFGQFADSARKWPDRPALKIGDRAHAYRDLERLAFEMARTISQARSTQSQLTAIFAHRSLPAYVGVLGAMAAGGGYVPLHPAFPAERNRRMLTASGATSVVLDSRCSSVARDVLVAVPTPLLVLLLQETDVPEWAQECPQHSFVRISPDGGDFEPVVPDPENIAYLLFTSGSTGVPKGVMVPHRSVLQYVSTIRELFAPTEQDRFSQSFDLTFDLSAHDMFVSWACGACLCVIPERALIAPAKFILDEQLTFWFSVPSAIPFMKRLRLLKPGAFASLRVSLFCGEALPVQSALDWSVAASNSIIENLYGPTEATIAITRFRFGNDVKTANGIVPIGEAFADQQTMIVDDQTRSVEAGMSGELCLSGSQLALGYLNDQKQTAERFVTLRDDRGNERRWYRTGDLVKRDDKLGLVYLGRLDTQTKILGHRVELGEVECALRRAAETDLVAALSWPPGEAGATEIIAFVSGSDLSEGDILAQCRVQLPPYMVPKEVHRLAQMPLNANGKIDRVALREHKAGLAMPLPLPPDQTGNNTR